MELIRKEALASQALAVIKGGFDGPSNEDTLDILKRAAERVQGDIKSQASEEPQPLP